MSDGGSHGSVHSLWVGIMNTDTLTEKVGVKDSLRCDDVGVGNWTDSSQSSFVGVVYCMRREQILYIHVLYYSTVT